MFEIIEDNLAVYTNLFKGREDVYAKYWEKNGKSGYYPAFDVDWDAYRAHTQKGGTFKNFETKKYLPLTIDVYKKHLLGGYAIGLYPILENNISYLLVADFDGENWQVDIQKVHNLLQTLNIPLYIELSKSGKGAHGWLFFETAIECSLSRKFMLEAIRQALNFSAFEKEISFDRLIPNQDYLSGKGLGNLIALPLQGRHASRKARLFLDPTTLTPIHNQFAYLASIAKISREQLLKAQTTLSDSPQVTEINISPQDSALDIIISNAIKIPKNKLNKKLINFLRDELNFINSAYIAKTRIGKSVYGTEKYLKGVTENESYVFVPRGFLEQLVRFLKTEGITHNLIPDHSKFSSISFSNHIQLYPEQQAVIDQAFARQGGIIISPPGSGKTIMGLELIARHKLPALTLVHRRELLQQWKEKASALLGISKSKIGVLSGTKKDIGKQVTIAMLQTLANLPDLSQLQNLFGTIIVDECHHIPARSYRNIVSQFNPVYLYGLTATPERKHNDSRLIFAYLGNIAAEMKGSFASPDDILDSGDNQNKIVRHKQNLNIVIQTTELQLPFNYATDRAELAAKVICYDTTRNLLIVKTIISSIETNKKILLLSERKEHLEILSLYLKGKADTIVITGDDGVNVRQRKLKLIKNG